MRHPDSDDWTEAEEMAEESLPLAERIRRMAERIEARQMPRDLTGREAWDWAYDRALGVFGAASFRYPEATDLADEICEWRRRRMS